MANTYILIASNTLTSAAASVTFSSIPATYVDLVLRVTGRSTNNTVSFSQLQIQFNNTGTVYSDTTLYGYQTIVASARSSGGSRVSEQGRGSIVGGANTASTFGSTEVYIPNYTTSANKPIALFGVNESNDTTNTALISQASLYRDTNAITTLTASSSSGNFAIGSSFFLYGIN